MSLQKYFNYNMKETEEGREVGDILLKTSYDQQYKGKFSSAFY